MAFLFNSLAAQSRIVCSATCRRVGRTHAGSLAFVTVRAVKQKETSYEPHQAERRCRQPRCRHCGRDRHDVRGRLPGGQAEPAQQTTDVPTEKKAPVDQAAPSARRSTVDTSGRNVHIDAPTTAVDVGKDTGKVRVKAPYTNVKVDRGQVRVRAPYVDLNIRW
jgi:hypothetical protein